MPPRPIKEGSIRSRLSKHLRTAFTFAIALLFVAHKAALTRAAGGSTTDSEDIWLAPLNKSPENGDIGSVDYMALFQPDSPWETVSKRITTFKLYPYFTGHSSDNQLSAVIDDLRRRHISIALEARALAAAHGNCTSDGGATTVPLLNRIKRLGGEVKYLAMDEPMKHWYFSKDNCRAGLGDIAAEIARNVRSFRQVFPSLKVGDIEPVGTFKVAPDLPSAIIKFLEEYQVSTGEPIGFFHADVIWTSRWEQVTVALAERLKTKAIPFGMIYNGTDLAPSDEAWTGEAVAHFETYERDKRRVPDTSLFQSWVAHPTHVLPESDATSLTGVALQYLRHVGR